MRKYLIKRTKWFYDDNLYCVFIKYIIVYLCFTDKLVLELIIIAACDCTFIGYLLCDSACINVLAPLVFIEPWWGTVIYCRRQPWFSKTLGRPS